MAEIFLSYKKEEKRAVERLAQGLEAWGLSVWYDTALLGGTLFRQTIRRELVRCKGVVVCWSRQSVRSAWVTSEAQYAFEQDKYIPVFFEDCDLPMPFDVVHTINLIDWNGDQSTEAFLDLIRAIAEKTSRSDLLDAVVRRGDLLRTQQNGGFSPRTPVSKTYSFVDLAELLDRVRPDVQTFDPDVMVSFDSRGGLWAELLMDQMSQRIPILIGMRVLTRGPRKSEDGFKGYPLIQSARWNLHLPPSIATLPRTARILYVDDYSQTGETCLLFRKYVRDELGFADENIKTLTLLTTPEAESLGQSPDLFGERTIFRPRLFYMSIR